MSSTKTTNYFILINNGQDLIFKLIKLNIMTVNFEDDK